MWSSLLISFSYFYMTNRIDSKWLQADSAEKMVLICITLTSMWSSNHIHYQVPVPLQTEGPQLRWHSNCHLNVDMNCTPWSLQTQPFASLPLALVPAVFHPQSSHSVTHKNNNTIIHRLNGFWLTCLFFNFNFHYFLIYILFFLIFIPLISNFYYWGLWKFLIQFIKQNTFLLE